MDHLLFESDDVPLGIIGRIHSDRSRPALLAVNGSFPPDDFMHDLVDRYPGAHVLVANLPGMAGVYWAKTTVARMTLALEAAVERLLPNDPLVAMGISTGNLLSLGLRGSNIRRRVAIKPFFQTQDLWPFIADSQDRLALHEDAQLLQHVEYMSYFLWEVFGIASTSSENRDYRHLLSAIGCPTEVMVGELPLLPQRQLDTWPSFTSDEDRALLVANPFVTLHVGPPGTGHGYGSMPSDLKKLHALVHGALIEAAQFCV